VSVILVSWLLITSFTLIASVSNNSMRFNIGTSDQSFAIQDINHIAYEPHERISIYGDDDFVSQRWPGNGTSESPYIIEGLEIISNYDCIGIHGTTAYFIVRGCLTRSLTPSEHTVGIRVQSASHGIVENCIIEMKGEGLDLLLSSNIVLRNNTIRNTPGWGLRLSSSTFCEIRNNTIYTVPSSGIQAFSLTSCTIVNNTIHDCESSGISINNSADCDVSNNTIHDCLASGIYLFACTTSSFDDNTIRSNSGPGIYNYDSDQCNFANNEIFQNGEEGIFSNRGDSCVFERNLIHENTQYGLYLYYGLSCSLTDNIFINDGLAVMGSSVIYWDHQVLTNTVNGKYLGYFFGESNSPIDGENYGQIIFANCSAMQVQGGDIGNSDIGIACYLSSHITADSTYIHDEIVGVYLYAASNCNISAVTMLDCGVSVVGGGLDDWIHDFTGTLVNGLPIAYCLNETYATIDGSLYGQAIIVNSTNVQLSNGSFINASQGIALAYSSECSIVENNVSGGLNGIRVRASENSHFENNSVTNSMDSAIMISYSENCTFSNNTVSGSDIGIYVYQSEKCSINESTVFLNYYGIYVSTSGNVNLSDNVETANFRGIQFSTTQNSTITNESIYLNDECGMYMYSADFVDIQACVIQNNGYNGIYFTSSSNGTIVHNQVNKNGYDGISIWTSDGFKIVNNTASENVDYGILLHHFCANNVVYGNTLVDNFYGNGYDYESENQWDDGISKGNSWSDYIGPGPYYLDGPGNNLDHFPTGPAVVLTHHNDASYLLTSPSATLTWHAFSAEPDYFIVYRDGVVHDSGTWDGFDIKISIATVALGVFNYTLFINGTSGEWKTSTVMVTIYDNAPTIDSPVDSQYNFDTLGHSITWHPSDYNPYAYAIYKNGVILTSEIWNGLSITISIDGLAIGSYHFMIRVNDTSGNSAEDVVHVTVYDIAPFVEAPWGDITYLLGTTGHSIFWNAQDANPENYTIYANGIAQESNNWTGLQIIYPVDGLPVGQYNYTIILYDTSGLSASNTVMVQVSPEPIVTSTTTTSVTTQTNTTTPAIQIDSSIIILIGVTGAAIVILFIIISFKKRP
jgi:parallel beta-helix repeat protein